MAEPDTEKESKAKTRIDPGRALHKLSSLPGWFADLPEAMRRAMAPHLIFRSYAADETIYAQGDEGMGIYGIISGQIKTIGAASDGQLTLLSMLRDGEWTGFLMMLDGGANPFTVSANAPTTIAFLPKAAVLEIFGKQVETLQFILQPLLKVLHFGYRYLVDTNGRPPTRVVAQRLLDLARCIYIPGSPTHQQLESISQEDIGQATYLTRPTVNRALKQLTKKGAISLGYSRVQIENVGLLDRLAKGQDALGQDAPLPPDFSSPWSSTEREVRAPAKLNDILQAGGWFPILPGDVQARVRDAMVFRQLQAKEVAFSHGQLPLGVYFVADGFGKLIGESRDGGKALLNVGHTGEWTSFSAALAGDPHDFSFVASRKTVLGLLPLEALQQIFYDNADHFRLLFRPALMRLRHSYSYFIDTSWLPPPQLVAQRLLEMSRHIYRSELSPRNYIENLRQDDIAMGTGLSRPTVNRVLQELDARGIIELGYGRIQILDPKALTVFSHDGL
jgi:CRP/FNR family transcriptional regulator, cyclic AMP receptor protein